MCHNHPRSYLNHMSYIALLVLILQETNISAFTAPLSAVGHQLCWKYMVWWYYISVACLQIHFINSILGCNYCFKLNCPLTWRVLWKACMHEGSKTIHDIQVVFSALWATKIYVLDTHAILLATDSCCLWHLFLLGQCKVFSWIL